MEKWITTTDQTKIYYEIKGQGPALIFLHGNSQTGRVFQKQVAYFSNFYTCITVDTRAHGKSFFEGERLTFQKLADDVIEIINHEKIETAYLLGFSDGANIAMILAAQEPQRFF
ncbi:alpha/beta fold hydrolase [Lactococcus fujiensis]|uniref:alpha/beta fold hydrolase n=1 Tax=Lactococcus fujiensis TaxID=610251 RepID=UPI000ACA5F5F|nr:alpha/beta hydrolase [Lactococcus fujiensis]